MLFEQEWLQKPPPFEDNQTQEETWHLVSVK